jgi:hypothetical protein
MGRILNADALTSHDNIAGRKAMVQILEAGLSAGRSLPASEHRHPALQEGSTTPENSRKTD